MTEPRPQCEDCKHFRRGMPPHICMHTGKSALWERAVNIGQVVNCGPKAQFFEAVRVRKALGVSDA